MDYYLVTIRTRGKSYTTYEELTRFYSKCINMFIGAEWSAFRCYEITAKGRRLHLHTILSLTKGALFNNLISSVNNNRIYIHLKKFNEDDYNNVVSYIQKQQQNIYDLEQLLIRNEYYNKYGFL